MPTEAQWYWSQRGVMHGPVTIGELQALVASGSIERSTWIYEPTQGAWVVAESVPELFAPAPSGSVPQPPPDAPNFAFPPPSTSPSMSPSSAPPPHATPKAFVLDPKLATVLCRAAVLVLPVANVLSFAAVGVIWALGAKDASIVQEARQTMNCLLTLALIFVVSIVVGFVLTIILIGPFIAGAVALALVAYSVIVGAMGLLAAGRGEQYRYPLTIEFIR